jgi:hypothetical protein
MAESADRSRDAGDTGWQRDLSVSHNKVGDVRVAPGDLAGALGAYQAGLAIAERLAARDAGNGGWQRDLLVPRSKIGDALPRLGAVAGARRSADAARDLRAAEGPMGRIEAAAKAR